MNATQNNLMREICMVCLLETPTSQAGLMESHRRRPRRELTFALSRTVLSFLGALALGTLNLAAADTTLVWTGDASDVWDNPGDNNWTNAATGAACNYSDGVIAYLSDRYTGVTDVHVGLAEFCPSSVIFDVDDAFTFTQDGRGGLRDAVGSFIKRGPGTLTVVEGVEGRNTICCGVDVEAGKLALSGVGRSGSWRMMLGNLISNAEVRVSSGAELSIEERLQFSEMVATNRAWDANDPLGPLGGRIVLDGGTLTLDQSKSGEAQHSANAIRDLVLNNGAQVSFKGTGSGSTGKALLRVADKVAVGGTSPSSISYTDMTKQKWMLDFEHPTEFEIADVTGDAAVDFVFPGIFSTFTQTLFPCPYPHGALLKTGTGTMQLVQTKELTSFTYLSDIEVREGTLVLGGNDPTKDIAHNTGRVTSSLLGDLTDANRKIEITGGTLYITERGMLDRDAGYGATLIQTPMIVTNGGTLKLSKKGTPNLLGPLVFSDGHFDYEGGRSGNVGMCAVKGTVKISGQNPAVWPSVDLGYWFLLPNYDTVFDVDDITNDGGVDFDFGLWFTLPYTLGTIVAEDCGFTKAGTGTMRIAANHEDINYNGNYLGFLGEVRVNAGTLQVDGSIASNLVTIASGAYLSGTGTVGHVTVAAGGGFAPRVRQAAPLRIRGNLELPRTGVIDVYVPAGFNPNKFKVDFAQVCGEVTSDGGDPFAGWTLRVNGQVPETNFLVRRVGDTFRCTTSPGFGITLK